MGVAVLVLWAVLASALPDAMPARWSIDRHAPDLFVAFAVWLGVRGTGVHVVGWSVVLGLFADAASLDPLGTHAFTLGLVTMLCWRPRGDRRAKAGAGLAAAVAGGTVLARVVGALRALPLHREADLPGAFAASLPTALWTALASWPLLALLDRTGLADDLTGRRSARAA